MDRQLLPCSKTASGKFDEYVGYVRHRAFLKFCILAILPCRPLTNFGKQSIHHLLSLLTIATAKQIQVIQDMVEII